MMPFAVLLLLLSRVCYGSDTWSDDDDQKVLILNELNFHQSVKQEAPMLVYFHIEKCEACNRINSVLKNMSSLLHSQVPSIQLASVDCDIHHSLHASEAIRKFPTIRMYSRDSQFEYDGAPYFDSLFAWTKRVTGAPVKPVASNEELRELLQQHSMVLLFTGETSSPEHRTLEQLANEQTNVFFASGRFEGFGAAKLMLLRNFDTPVEHYEGEPTKSSISSWIESKSSATVDLFDTKTTATKMFKEVGVKSLVIFTEDMSTPEYAAFFAVAAAASQQFVATRAAPSSESGRVLFSYLGAEKKETADVWIIEKQEYGIKRFRFDGEVTEAGLQQFLLDFQQGLLLPTLKSQPVPAEQPSEGVIYLVGKNFDQLVRRCPESVFVFFYAPQCKHSGLFGPVFDELANSLNAHRDVLKFGVIDGSANEVHGLDVAGFPSLYLFRAGEKDDPVEYAEARKKKALLEFLLAELPNDESTGALKRDLQALLGADQAEQRAEKQAEAPETDL